MAIFVTIANKSYVEGCAVMLYSLVKNNPFISSNKIKVISEDLSDQEIKSLPGKPDKINIDTEKYKNISFFLERNNKRRYLSAYFKYELFSLEDDVIYIDSDCLIIGDVSRLFSLGGECLISAGEDIEIDGDIFNSGVMKISPRKDITDKLIKYTVRMYKLDGNTYDYDQTIMNRFFKSYAKIPIWYNFFKFHYKVNASWLCNVKIIHYVAKKPWDNTFIYNSANSAYNKCIVAENKWKQYQKSMETIKNT